MSRRLHVGPVGATLAGLVVIVGTFLPWLRSGSSARSSYDLLGLFDRIDLAEDGPVAWLVRWWPVVPLLVTIAVVLVWARRHGWAMATSLVASTYAGGVGTVMLVAAQDTPVRLGPGPLVTTIGSVLLVAAAAAAIALVPTVRPDRLEVGSLPSPHADP